jgi:Nitroreductase family.
MKEEIIGLETIKKRVSVRTCDAQPLSGEDRGALEGFIASARNPFGAQTRFSLLSVAESKEKIGTYGFLRGVQQYIAGCVKQGGMDLEGYGYAMERIVLYATALGLGTCWLGIFRRGPFGEAMKPQGELMPAVAAVGYAAEKKSIAERMMAAGAGARTRKPFETLFFEADFKKPMDAQGTLRECLEMVRIAPSASNKQPWRAARQGGAVHFYIEEDKGYAGNRMLGFCIQRVDSGIAACHFDLAAKELGLPGSFEVGDPGLNAPEGWRYGFSWR